MNTIRIGTRESRLAVVQAEMVAAAIRRDNPDQEVELVTMKTTGDIIQDRTLDKVGGKGLFVKELDAALSRKDVDICVHSYKDMPADINLDMPVIAVSHREDPQDVLILPVGATGLDPEKPIGCSSQRRQVQLAELYPGQQVAPVRGNVITRLAKLDRGDYSALVLAAAGIKRLGLWDRVNKVFDTEEMLPAGCQGVLAIQGRADEDHSYLAKYNDPDAWDCTTAERAFVRKLDSGCGAPVAVYAVVSGEKLHIKGIIIGAEGTIYRDEITGSREQADALGLELAGRMIERRERDAN